MMDHQNKVSRRQMTRTAAGGGFRPGRSGVHGAETSTSSTNW